EIVDESAHVFQRLARRDAEPLMGRTMADPDSEAKPAARDLVEEGRGLGEVIRMPGVHVGDAAAERDLARAERDRLAEPEAVAEARAVEAGEAFLLEPPRHLDRRLPSSGHGGE